MVSFVPAITKFIFVASSFVGFIISFQSFNQILTAPTGEEKGIPANIIAKFAAKIPGTQYKFCLSICRVLIVKTTSFVIHSKNMGLILLSISLETKIASSDGFHSFLL
jgi:hypothetical protein